MKFSASCLFGWPEKLSTTMKFPQKQSTLEKSIWKLFVCFCFLIFTRSSRSRRYVSVFLSNLFLFNPTREQQAVLYFPDQFISLYLPYLHHSGVAPLSEEGEGVRIRLESKHMRYHWSQDVFRFERKCGNFKCAAPKR